jgi:hypothetical protein
MKREILDLADRKYQLRAKDIEKKYQKLKNEIRFRTMTDYREQIEVEKLLPQKLEEKSNALVDCYLQTFEAAGLVLECHLMEIKFAEGDKESNWGGQTR